MAIIKLTSDDLREPSREITQLAKLNEIITAVNNASDGGTPSAGTFSTLVVSSTSAFGGAMSLFGSANVDVIDITDSGAGQTASKNAIDAHPAGSYDTTAGALIMTGINSAVTSTRSAGANTLTNTALKVRAAGAQVNIAIDADNGGDVLLAGATDKVGFFASAGAVKGTVNGTVITATAGTALAQLLVILAAHGLITDSHTDV